MLFGMRQGWGTHFRLAGGSADEGVRRSMELILLVNARLLCRGRIWNFSGGGRGLRWVGGADAEMSDVGGDDVASYFSIAAISSSPS
jgi:hypothetical protein